MKKYYISRIIFLVVLFGLLFVIPIPKPQVPKKILSEKSEMIYWFILHRKSNIEFLYKGEPGEIKSSKLIKKFRVKTGIPGERPTPLPQLVGRKYWIITEKADSSESAETAPYFLTLDVPVGEYEPFGPTPYLECGGAQCNWILPGAFGLHGVAGDESRLSVENPGSSGCIRHRDEDITYLYNLLDPLKQEIRYYIEDL